MGRASTVFETIWTAPWWRSACRISWLICSGVSIIRPCIFFLLRRTEILLTAHHVTEELPLLAVEALQLHRFNGKQWELFGEDRKSTRLNSSHQIISYAVFSFKKKKRTPRPAQPPTPSTPP